MANLFDRVGMAVSAGGTGTISLGSALGAVAPNLAPFQTLANGGALNGNIVSYLILDANGNVEWGTATYNTSGTTLSSRTVTGSIIAGVPGTTAINVTTGAHVFISLRAEDHLINSLPGPWTLAANDGNVITNSGST